ncbi:hypothetical protein [Chitinibacter sp. ZOR0017]|uniref:hypothetical protein n=1 Tax=Chitinibacter sp. ZOR0017 TaxID=1339254 RepID=UPI0012E02EDF|nr:hypothetical protein [Chitinibacter sp. ZOR0017]
MIESLQKKGLLSVIESEGQLMSYTFIGKLNEAFELLNKIIVEVIASQWQVTPHSCATVIEKSILDEIDFFKKLPSIPFHVIPHSQEGNEEQTTGKWVLNPSTCYHTFNCLRNQPEHWILKCFTALGHCHRFEPRRNDLTRLGCFSMREFVFVGDSESVASSADKAFDLIINLIERCGLKIQKEIATDVFYGDDSAAIRKVQRILEVKIEAVVIGPQELPVSVGSRNLHRDLFTATFNIGDPTLQEKMHSACVAFGMERLLLCLLAIVPDNCPIKLIEILESSKSNFNE